jgi:hypothetical protein
MEDAEELSADDLAQKPWKYLGYRAFSDLVASDDSLLMVRRFSVLTARVLLSLQDALTQDEERLEKLERQLAAKDAADVHNGSFRQEPQQKRKELLQEIDAKLRNYSRSLLCAAGVSDRGQTSWLSSTRSCARGQRCSAATSPASRTG